MVLNVAFSLELSTKVTIKTETSENAK